MGQRALTESQRINECLTGSQGSYLGLYDPLGVLDILRGLRGFKSGQRNSNGSKSIQVRHKEFQGGQMSLREYPEVLEGSRKYNGSNGLPHALMEVLMDSRDSKEDLGVLKGLECYNRHLRGPTEWKI